MLLPNLSEKDPEISSEGSIDPLGLYSIADALGVRMVPGVRERQSYPRFLTAMAVSAVVCEAFDEERVAADGVSEPWQVFEWYVVEGLVRTAVEDDMTRGLPGKEKARTAIMDGVPLSADRYLKTPSVFGFHGVYRLLARTLGVESAGRLGELGYELVTTWAEEQGLPGFVGTGGGEGARWVARLRDAVEDGLRQGHVKRRAGWSGWQFFRQYLSPHEIGPREAELIRRALLGSEDGYRGTILKFLVSRKGRRSWITLNSEHEFHQALYAMSEGELRSLLQAIMLYERFSRVLQDAFDDCRYTMTGQAGKTTLEALARTAGIKAMTKQLPVLYRKVAESVEPFGEAVRFEQTFYWAADKCSAAEWVTRLLEHHRAVQQRKPPNGKAPWVEILDGGGYLIRPAYREEEGGRHDSSYVHAYRTEPLWSFAQDLRWVS